MPAARSRSSRSSSRSSSSSSTSRSTCRRAPTSSWLAHRPEHRRQGELALVGLPAARRSTPAARCCRPTSCRRRWRRRSGYLMMVLPLIFISVVAHFPIGLVLYWVTTNLWTVGQGLVTRRLVPRTPLARRRSAARSGRREHPPTAERRGGNGDAGNGARAEAAAAASRQPPDAAAPCQAQEGRRPRGDAASCSPSRRPARPSARRSGRRCASSSGSRRRSTRRRCASRCCPRASAACSASATTPARVLASVDAATRAARGRSEPVDESEAAGRLRDAARARDAALGIRCRIDVAEDGDPARSRPAPATTSGC